MFGVLNCICCCCPTDSETESLLKNQEKIRKYNEISNLSYKINNCQPNQWNSLDKEIKNIVYQYKNDNDVKDKILDLQKNWQLKQNNTVSQHQSHLNNSLYHKKN